MTALARGLVALAVAASVAAVALLTPVWFEAVDAFAAVYGRDGVALELTAFDASSGLAVAAIVLAAGTVVAALVAARGTFFAWAVGAAAAMLGALVCLIVRADPPDPESSVYVPGEVAYDPTGAPVAAAGCFLVAAAALTAWALIRRPAA